MPLVNKQNSFEWEDPDIVPRPIVTIGAAALDIQTLSPEERNRHEKLETDFHRHRKGQFLLWLRGVLTCEVDGGYWVVPAQSAIWIPAGVEHRMATAGNIECYVVYIEPEQTHNLPTQCCTLSTTALLRELVIRSASFPLRYDEGGMTSRLNTLLLDEIALAKTGTLHLPMPRSPKLRKIMAMIIDAPSDRATIQVWARRTGSSERTLSRLIVQETGMSFGRWRRQLHLMLALQWLAKGASVQRISDGLGYESTSSFALMFQKALGVSPTRYVSEYQV